MDPSTLGPPDTGRPTPGYAALDRDYVPPPPEPDERRHPIVRHIVLFILTFLLTTFVGVDHYYGFQSDFSTAPPPQLGWTAYFNGLWYSLAILGILGAHEFGHYLACVYYRVDASLPYLHPGAPADGHAWRLHQDPSAHSRQAPAVRHRHRGTHRRVSRGRSRARARHLAVQGRPDPGRSRPADWSWASRSFSN